MGLTQLDNKGLEDAAGYAFYNTSKWTLKNCSTPPPTTSRADSIKAHPDFAEKYKNNQDSHNRLLAFEKIFEEVMLEKRRNELELYKLLASDVAFKAAMQQSLQEVVDG